MKKKWMLAALALAGGYAVLRAAASAAEEPDEIDADNPYLSPAAERDGPAPCRSVYGSAVKPALDSVLSFGGLVALLPFYAAASAAVYLDDPGPVFFAQKRVARGKGFFMMHKFRSMKMSTPHDVPTHLLEDPERYITRLGRILRKTSLDELPQLWDVFRRKLSLVGPRPALWNQADLVAERDKYGANDVMPGLTGWAQINGRDELSIEEKARYDGEYAAAMRAGGWTAFAMDARCLFGTIGKVLRRDGVLEGGPDHGATEAAKQ